MDRRQFLVRVGSGALVVALPDLHGRARLGMSDVDTLREPLDRLVALDSRRGGATLAPAAAAVVARIEAVLTQCQVSDRVRRAMYSLAGEYLASAGWFAIDAGDLPAATRYLDHALRVSVISRDATVQSQIWNAMAWRADQGRQYSEVLAIAQSALASTASRRNPRLAALWHGWSAQAHAWAGSSCLAERSMLRAHSALDRSLAVDGSPPWLNFLDRSELYSQAAFSQLALGHYVAAEATAKAALSLTPTSYPRNRVSRQVLLTHAYLGQREVEQAAVVAAGVLDSAGDLHSGRLSRRYHALNDQFSVWARDIPAAAAWTHRFLAQAPSL